MARKTWAHHVGLALPLALFIALPAVAATSFSNSLTGFTGDLTQATTQTAVGAAGFNFSSTAGFDPETGNGD